jgi:2,3-diketo-5-methylthiopentyl-1-phosphate enolase
MLSEFNGLKNTYPSPAAGLYPGLVPQIMSDIGEDVMLGAGAAMHAHPDGLKAGVLALRQAAEAWKLGIPLEKYAETHKELADSIKIWGVFNPNKSIFELTN